MEWTDIRLTVAKADAENAEAVATLIAEGGIYIEDYSDIEQQVAEIAHVDLIEQELLDKPRDTVIIHLYLEPGAKLPNEFALGEKFRMVLRPTRNFSPSANSLGSFAPGSSASSRI
jgi:ribosomal protein L11 methyltransferase